jgi:hypothetical protein
MTQLKRFVILGQETKLYYVMKALYGVRQVLELGMKELICILESKVFYKMM